MTEATKPTSLADLAKRVQEKADLAMRSWSSEELTKLLRTRCAQLEAVGARAGRVVTHRSVVLMADPSAKLPKKRISLRVKSLLKLEAAAEIDIRKIVEANVIDVQDLGEALQEAEKALLEAWQKFARPPKEASGADALFDVPELEQAARQLRATRQQLEEISKQLPTTEADVRVVRELQERLTALGDQIRTRGYPDEVLVFLSQVRTARGVPLADVLNNPTLRAWLDTKRNASALRVLHDSALNPTSPFHP
jgi:hypothetical protein